MNALIAPKCLIANAGMHKVLTIILHTLQMTQATSPPKVKPKWIFYIGCDQPTPTHGHYTFYPCSAFGKGCEHLNG
jgi:hypothetical protein